MPVKEAKTAMPPRRGVGAAWTLREPGWSRMPHARAARMVRGTSAAVTAAHATRTSAPKRTWSMVSGRRGAIGEELAVQAVDVAHQPCHAVLGEDVRARGIDAGLDRGAAAQGVAH